MTKCPKCEQEHPPTARLSQTAHDILIALVEARYGPSDIIYIMATIASSVTAAEGPTTLDDRIATFKRIFEEMTRDKVQIVEKVKPIMEALDDYLNKSAELDTSARTKH